MQILKFDQFKINEKHGVSESSIMFIDVLEEKIYNLFISFLESDKKSYKDKVDIKYRSLASHITDNETYSDFPVVGFELIVNFGRLSAKKFSDVYNLPEYVVSTGYAAGFGHKNWKNYSKIVDPKRKITKVGLIIQLYVTVEIDKDNFSIENNNEALVDEIRSTLYHELNHAYEHYKRTTKAPRRGEYRKPIYDRSFSTAITYAERNIWKFPNDVWQYWRDEFLYFIYKSEPFELNANIQEIDFFIKKYPNRELSDFEIWNYADMMEKFNADEFYKNLLKIIRKSYNLDKHKKDVDKSIIEYLAIDVVDKLKDMWVEVYERELKSQKAKPIIPLNTLNKMSGIDFIKYWANQFNKNGKYVKRKIAKIKYDTYEKV